MDINEQLVKGEANLVSSVYVDATFFKSFLAGRLLCRNNMTEQIYSKLIADLHCLNSRITDDPEELLPQYQITWDDLYEEVTGNKAMNIFMVSPSYKSEVFLAGKLKEFNSTKNIFGEKDPIKVHLNTYPIILDDSSAIAQVYSNAFNADVRIIAKPYEDISLNYDAIFVGDFFKFSRVFEKEINSPDLISKYLFALKVAHTTDGHSEEELKELFDLTEQLFDIVTNFQFVTDIGFV